MIEIIEKFHNTSFVHRDIKPENFLMGLNDKCNIVHMVNFGFVRKYINKNTNQHIRNKNGLDLVRTAKYASLNAHRGYELSRRDDLESIGYVLAYFLRGSLPWQDVKSIDRNQLNNKIYEIKKSTSIEDLCKGFPSEFITYFNYCRNLEFESAPDYQYLKQLFKDIANREGILLQKEGYDWDITEKQQIATKNQELTDSDDDTEKIQPEIRERRPINVTEENKRAFVAEEVKTSKRIGTRQTKARDTDETEKIQARTRERQPELQKKKAVVEEEMPGKRMGTARRKIQDVVKITEELDKITEETDDKTVTEEIKFVSEPRSEASVEGILQLEDSRKLVANLPIKSWKQIKRLDEIYRVSTSDKRVEVYQCEIVVNGSKIIAAVKFNLVKRAKSQLNDSDLSISDQALYMAKMQNNENFLKLYGSFWDVYEGNHRYNLVMEHATESLKSRIETWDDEDLDKPSRIEEAYQVARVLIKAMYELNQCGISHRDIKPANILIGDENVYKIIDFDIAEKAIKNTDNITVTNKDPTASGTLQYMAPELYKKYQSGFKQEGEKILYNKCDVYSLGLTILRMVTKAQEGNLNKGMGIQAGVNKIVDAHVKEPRLNELLKSMLTKTVTERPKFEDLYNKLYRT